MAIYRFRVSFEDYDDIERDIDIRSSQTFEDLHRAIHQATGYNPDVSSSFYVSNDQWIKNEEIAFMPSKRKIDNGVATMAGSKLSSFIDDPHQKFYYTYNFDRPFDFHVELINISLKEDSGKTYPVTVRSVGEAPKIAVPGVVAAASAVNSSDDFDFLNEEDFQPEDTEELEKMTSLSDEGEEVIDEEESDDSEKDEFMDEFSDNERYDADDLQKDDY